jgi:hypothetical protein
MASVNRIIVVGEFTFLDRLEMLYAPTTIECDALASI